MKKIILASLLAAVGAANAGTIVLDNFSVSQAAVVDSTSAGAGQSGSQAIGGGVTRTITVDLLQPSQANPNSQGAEAGVSGNRFYVSNGSGDGTTISNSNVTLGWTFSNAVLSGLNPITYAQLVMDVVIDQAGAADGITGSLGAQARSVTSDARMIWNIAPTALTSPGQLALVFSGNPGWDFSGRLLTAQYTCQQVSVGQDGLVASFATLVTGSSYNDGCTPVKVPLPGTVALLGIGMLGVAAARRAKRA